MRSKLIRLGLLALFISALAGCSGSDGAAGPAGATGATGATGAAGESADNFKVSNFHGEATLEAEHLATAGQLIVNTTITGATVAADGTVTVNFTVKKKDGTAITDLDTAVPTGATTPVAVNATVTYLDASGNWVPYFQNTENSGTFSQAWKDGEAAAFAANGKTIGNIVAQATTSGGNAINNLGGGNYTLVLSKKIVGQVEPNTTNTADLADGETITYDATRTHRVSLQHGGHNGYTGNAEHDFVPDGSAGNGSRNIVSTTACNQCHKKIEIHGGSRFRVETCVTCHNPTNFDSSSDVTMDAKVLFHKIHMGSSMVNGLVIGHRGNSIDYGHIGFPAKVQNCEKCHYQPTGETLANVDNWKTKPSRAACGSCHDDVDFATGTNHPGGAQPDDAGCTYCHQSTGTQTTDGQAPAPIPAVHAVTRSYDYTTDITMTPPANGTHYVAGEAPVVTIVMKKNGVAIDHTTVNSVNNPNTYLFVSGPRGSRKPVLTTQAALHAVQNSANGSYANNTIYQHLNASGVPDTTLDDPRVTWTAGNIQYQLAAIPANMKPGTYVAYVSARDNADAVGVDGVDFITFQVGQVAEQKPIANGCNDCHGRPAEVVASATSLALDNVMHGNRPFNVDICGNCHDYQAQKPAVLGDGGQVWSGGAATKANNQGFGAGPISRRVHGVHFGSSLNYPLEVHSTYGAHYANVTLPQDVRNCEKCHGATTSGTWKTNPNRLACNGCHDSDAATAHTESMTWDPTPLARFSGDESEACAVCHAD